KPDQAGKAIITVYGEGLAPAEFEYRVKKIPDPVLEIARKRGGTVPAATFRAQQGIIPVLEHFDFEARCEITGFEVVRKPAGADIAVALNNGGRFRETTKRLIQAAQRGDTYYFNDVKVRCPGDKGPAREMNSLIFKIR
ncbi:MAG: gliding motility protein GldM, partial [Phaeodactylibacter sp.]|nr:gliding motility protein GldM [Phaeodactylibacter sp.]